MKVLVACEYSQIVAEQFYALGHEVWSCDLLPGEKGLPHIQADVLKYLGECQANNFKGWDMMIAFPPCTHLAVSGAAWFEQKRKDGRQQQGVDFFMEFTKTNIEKVCIENPVGIMSSVYRKPDQIVHPYFFGDNTSKKTCFWLKNLPKLMYTTSNNLFYLKTSVVPEYVEYNSLKNKSGKSKYSGHAKLGSGSGKIRSKTYPGIAKAMAEQWG